MEHGEAQRYIIEIIPAKGNLPAVFTAALDNPGISGHSDRSLWQSCILGLNTPPSCLASFFRKVHVASHRGERYLAAKSSLCRWSACRLGRHIRRFAFWAFSTLHRNGLIKTEAPADLNECYT